MSDSEGDKAMEIVKAIGGYEGCRGGEGLGGYKGDEGRDRENMVNRRGKWGEINVGEGAGGDKAGEAIED